MNLTWIIWIAIGGAAGWLAGIITKGKGYGCIGNVIVGIIGSVVGGYLSSLLNISAPGSALVSSIVTAVAGAVILIIVLRMLIGGK